MATALTRGRVLTDHGLDENLVVVIEGRRIIGVARQNELSLEGSECVDLDGMILAPGFIDLQVNGGGDILLNDEPSRASLERMVAAHARFGTTSMLPTLISSDRNTLAKALAVVEDAVQSKLPGVLGLHVEGPFIAVDRRGAHDAGHCRAMDDADLQLLTSAHRGIRLVTLAPERVDPAQITALRRAGVFVAIGHSDATYEATRSALEAGAGGFTHLFNAMSPLLARSPGVVGAALEDRHAWCGIINDGHHVHPAALRIALAAKPRGAVFFVTDAMPPVGGSCETFALDGREIRCSGGRCATAGGTLAGSALDMATAVRNAVANLGVGAAEALRMAAEYPARAIGLAHERGRIAAGCIADLVALDDSFRVKQVWRNGARILP